MLHPHPDELFERFAEEAGRPEGWRLAGDSIVAAVSGGPDSMALLHLLCRMREKDPFRLVAAHLNHRFRGAEAEAEAVLVRETAAAWGVTAEIGDIDVPAFIAETGMNAQEAARERRYGFLEEIAGKYDAKTILLGHHADDQAETVLMRVLRGTGVGGLAGIPSRRPMNNVELFRPLLRITKRELLAYCERNEVPYAVDSSNLKRRYVRNAVRLDLMPMLEAYNPNVREALVRLANLASADDEYMEAETAKQFALSAKSAEGGFQWERRRFRSLHVALQRRLIKLILSCSAGPAHSPTFDEMERIVAAAVADYPTVVRLELGNGLVFVREYDVLYAGPDRRKSAFSGYLYELVSEEGELAIAETGQRVRWERVPRAETKAPDNGWEAFFDESELALPLIVRTRRPGDRISPYGLNGTKKVQDMFVDAKIARSARDTVPLVTDALGRVLWIPGMRRSALALPGEYTESTLRLTVEPTSSGHCHHTV